MNNKQEMCQAVLAGLALLQDLVVLWSPEKSLGTIKASQVVVLNEDM